MRNEPNWGILLSLRNHTAAYRSFCGLIFFQITKEISSSDAYITISNKWQWNFWLFILSIMSPAWMLILITSPTILPRTKEYWRKATYLCHLELQPIRQASQLANWSFRPSLTKNWWIVLGSMRWKSHKCWQFTVRSWTSLFLHDFKKSTCGGKTANLQAIHLITSPIKVLGHSSQAAERLHSA